MEYILTSLATSFKSDKHLNIAKQIQSKLTLHKISSYIISGNSLSNSQLHKEYIGIVKYLCKSLQYIK